MESTTSLAIFGHRGAAGEATENTLSAIRAGLDAGVSGIEIDVQCNRDGDVLVYHDATFSRMCGEDWYVEYSSRLDTQSLRAGGEPIPLLEDVIAIMSAHNAGREKPVVLNIEIKHTNAIEGVLALLKRCVNERKMPAKALLVSSFNQQVVRRFSRELPAVPRAVCLDGCPSDYAACLSHCRAQSLHVNADFLDPALVRDAINRGATVKAYTVNKPKQVARLTDMGVTGIFTDFPNRLIKG